MLSLFNVTSQRIISAWWLVHWHTATRVILITRDHYPYKVQ